MSSLTFCETPVNFYASISFLLAVRMSVLLCARRCALQLKKEDSWCLVLQNGPIPGVHLVLRKVCIFRCAHFYMRTGRTMYGICSTPCGPKGWRASATPPYNMCGRVHPPSCGPNRWSTGTDLFYCTVLVRTSCHWPS